MRLRFASFFGFLLLFLPLLAGCDSDSENIVSPLTNSPSAPAYALELSPQVEALRQEMLVPGVVVVVRSAEFGDWTAAFGYRDLEQTGPISIDDHFRIGSNTKPMTGTVILQLVEEGLLSLSDPIGDYIDGVPNGDIITIENLLEMRSGIPTYSNSVVMNEQLDNNPLRVWLPEELLAIAYGQESGLPGLEFDYSNSNFVLLGMVIEQLTGQSVEQEFQERLFAPLGLTEPLLPARTSNSIPAPFPRGYQFGTNISTLSGDALPPAQREQAYAGTLLPIDVTNENPSWAWTAGSGISTANELADYVEAMVGGGLLGSALQAQRLTSFIPVDPTDSSKPSYGWALASFGVGKLYGHTGELPGFNSMMGHDPERELTIVVWTNLNNAPDGRPPAVTIARLIVNELYSEIHTPHPGVDDE